MAGQEPKSTSLVLGLLGGMGPAATLDFLTKLQAFTPVKAEQDHIRVIADINPKVPDRNAPGSDAGPILAEMAGALRGAGADVLAIACNTAHAYADLIQRASGLPLIDMIETGAQVDHVDQRQARRALDQAGVGVGGVAGHGQNLRARALKGARHLGQHRTGLRARHIAVGRLGIDVGDHPDVVLILFCRRIGLDPGQKLQRGRRPHAAQHAQDQLVVAHDSWPSSSVW